MILTEPLVLLLAETAIDWVSLGITLREIGGKTAEDWGLKRIPTDVEHEQMGEMLIETAGRICYKSFGVGLNPNVTKIREDSKEYFANVLAKGDGSILEHGSCTFAFLNVSRVFTHELVRHRVGVAISQESGRYVRIDEEHPMSFWSPDLYKFNKYLKEKATSIPSLNLLAHEIEERYLALQNQYDWDKMSMQEKKELTSALRRILPNGQATNIIWTANHRTLRHVIEMRTAEGAEIEMRIVFDKVANILKERYPDIYQDFERKENGAWVPKYHKV